MFTGGYHDLFSWIHTRPSQTRCGFNHQPDFRSAICERSLRSQNPLRAFGINFLEFLPQNLLHSLLMSTEAFHSGCNPLLVVDKGSDIDHQYTCKGEDASEEANGCDRLLLVCEIFAGDLRKSQRESNMTIANPTVSSIPFPSKCTFLGISQLAMFDYQEGIL